MNVPDALGVAVVNLRVTLFGHDVTTATHAYQLDTRPRRRRNLYLYDRPRHDAGWRLVERGLTAAASQDPEGSFRSAVSFPVATPELERLRAGFGSTPAHLLRIQGDWTVHARKTLATLVYRGHRPAPTTLQPQRQSRQPATDIAWLFSDHQRRFPNSSRGNEQTPLDPLQPYGPIMFEYWQLPDHGVELRIRRLTLTAPRTPFQLLDITTPTTPEDAPLIYPTLAASVRRQGLDPDAFTGSRTRKLLDHLQ